MAAKNVGNPKEPKESFPRQNGFCFRAGFSSLLPLRGLVMSNQSGPALTIAPAELKMGDDFDFDVGAFGQGGDLDGGARREIVGEIRRVNFVHASEVGEVGQ